MLYFNPTLPHPPDAYAALFEYNILETPAGRLAEVPQSGMSSREFLWNRAKKFLSEEEIAAAPTRAYVLSFLLSLKLCVG